MPEQAISDHRRTFVWRLFAMLGAGCATALRVRDRMLLARVLIITGIIAAIMLTSCEEQEQERPAATPRRPPTIREQIEDCLSPLDGNHDGFEDRIRPLLNDEGSMRTHDTFFNGNPATCDTCRVNETTIRMVYSANNVFGARIKKEAFGYLNYKTCQVRILFTGLE